MSRNLDNSKSRVVLGGSSEDSISIYQLSLPLSLQYEWRQRTDTSPHNSCRSELLHWALLQLSISKNTIGI